MPFKPEIFVYCLQWCYYFEQPKFVIHCAAERRPDVMAKKVEESRALNIDATRIVCEEAGTELRMIFVS